MTQETTIDEAVPGPRSAPSNRAPSGWAPSDWPPPSAASRRAVLAGAGAAAVAVLAGCATYDQTGGPDSGGGAPPPGGDPGGTGDPGTPPAIAQTSEIPVGSGKIIDQSRVVVSQPQAGTFLAFTAVCTHQGCVVSEVRNSEILCGCHGSKFNTADGSVAGGPASRPLKAVAIVVEGTDIRLA